MDILRSVLVMAILLFPAIGIAQDTPSKIGESGNQFLAMCERPLNQEKGSTMGVYCMGWIAGLSEGIRAAQYSLTKQVPICFPDGATFGQFAQVMIKYMKDNPEKLNLPTSLLGFIAFHQAFPCTSEK